MKSLMLSAFLLLCASPAFAACPASLQLKDNVGVTANAKYTDDGSGNCQANIAVQDGADVTLGAKADAAWTTGTGSVIAVLKGIYNSTTGAIPAGTNVIGFTSTDPCAQTTKTNVAISTTTGTLQLVSGVSAKKVYVCSLSFAVASGAVFVNLIEGTGANCTTANEAAIIGSTVSTSGMSMAANGNFTLGDGSATVGVTATAANGICLFQSSTTIGIAGNLTYVQQ